jgi:hypothetical protein
LVLWKRNMIAGCPIVCCAWWVGPLRKKHDWCPIVGCEWWSDLWEETWSVPNSGLHMLASPLRRNMHDWCPIVELTHQGTFKLVFRFAKRKKNRKIQAKKEGKEIVD